MWQGLAGHLHDLGRHHLSPVDVIMVMNTPEQSSPQHKMEFVRNATENSLVFSDKKMKKRTIRMERKISKDRFCDAV